jgi:signal transduction histidine kinase
VAGARKGAADAYGAAAGCDLVVPLDGARFRRVLSNLVSNAVKYHGSGNDSGGGGNSSSGGGGSGGGNSGGSGNDSSGSGNDSGGGGNSGGGGGQSGKIRVLARLSQNRGFAVIEIRDHGRGISEEDLPRIFDVFFMSDRSRNKAAKSYGLGLAIAKEIVVAHGGKIWARSKLGSGTSIYASLPKSGTPTPAGHS